MNAIELCERGWVPDRLARYGMRGLMAERLRDEGLNDEARRTRRFRHLLNTLRNSPIAIDTPAANEQHYEVPAEFFKLHLGPCLKYSCCLYPTGGESLAQAEQAMLDLYVERARLEDGMRILDLGCGWGSLSLWLAERFPNSKVVGLSNSNGQREFILARARQRGLGNLTVITANVVDADFPHGNVFAEFDRVLSIEMFEHMRNYGLLLKKISRWLKPDGELFVHVFAHPTLAYPFEDEGQSDWMTRHFFSGGLMPSKDLFSHFQDDLQIAQDWWVDGRHYEKTSNHWLEGMDNHRDAIMAVFGKTMGSDAKIVFQRWRMFYMAVAEFFGYQEGRQWGVAHYRFTQRR